MNSVWWILAGVLIFAIGGKGINMLSGSYLTANQIAAYAQNAGFSGNALITAVAIALAESSGNPQASGDGGNSYGLWQIDYKYHPEFGIPGPSWYDPQTNANMAYSVYVAAGNSFNPWSSYSVNGTYAQYISTVQQSLNLNA